MNNMASSKHKVFSRGRMVRNEDSDDPWRTVWEVLGVVSDVSVPQAAGVKGPQHTEQ